MQEQFLKLISFGSIVIGLCIILFLLLELFKIKNPFKAIMIKYQIALLGIVSTIAILGSILLSTYFKIAPCELCWYQRAFLFATPVIAFSALYKKDILARIYIFRLSIIGAVIALYHSLIQTSLFKAESVFCNPASSSVDCSVAAFTYFGFVTIPFISFTIFCLLILISYEYKKI